MIIDQVFERVASKTAGRSVNDLRIGLGYVAVTLDNGSCGLAYTFRDEAGEGCCVLRQAGTLTSQDAMNIAPMAKSLDTISAAVGLATLNALIQPPPDTVEADAADLLQTGSEDVVGMVGYFAPWVARLRGRTQTLHIFERRSDKEEVLPDWAAPVLLPECTVVILSATTLLNRTLDILLDRCEHAREVAPVGPSTPFLPEVFARRKVTLLSGVQVIGAGRVLRVVSEGGGTRQFGSAVRKLALRIAT
jgi:uncharacterized protein (DUF4213/DUF364 family)